MQLIDFVGIVGGMFTLFGFYRTSIGRWEGTSFWYEFDNLIGAILMSFYAWNKAAFVSIFLNLIWGLVALHGVSSYAERRLVNNAHFKQGYRRGRKAIRKR